MIICVHFDKLFSFQVLIAARALCTMKGTKNTFLKSKQINQVPYHTVENTESQAVNILEHYTISLQSET